MRAVIQRVKRASVKVNNNVVSQINKGLLVFIGIGKGDNEKDFEYISRKIVNLRIFEDKNSKFNLTLSDVKGEVLIVSQFTLYGDCRKGRRPSFDKAESVENSEKIYKSFIEYFRQNHPDITLKEGIFQAHMEVELINDGPVTFLLDSKKTF